MEHIRLGLAAGGTRLKIKNRDAAGMSDKKIKEEAIKLANHIYDNTYYIYWDFFAKEVKRLNKTWRG